MSNIHSFFEVVGITFVLFIGIGGIIRGVMLIQDVEALEDLVAKLMIDMKRDKDE